MTLTIKRAYDPPRKTDGIRILVDRLWPRGLRKDKAKLDHWMKDVAPTPDLRKWFAHDPAKWEEFQLRYTLELRHNPAIRELRNLNARKDKATLIYAARDAVRNHASVLLRFLQNTEE